MTTQKSFKSRVRQRMSKTGESYTTARRHLLPADAPPILTDTDRALLMHGEEAVLRATAHGWEHWVAVLDDWGAAQRAHAEIARHLVRAHQVPGWWAQGIAVSYERVRGMRAVGQGSDGFTASVSRTMAVSADRAFDAFEEADQRERWLPGVDLRRRTATRPKNARYDWPGEDADSLLVVGITVKGPSKCSIAVQHSRLPDAEAVREQKLAWRARLDDLKALVEGE